MRCKWARDKLSQLLSFLQIKVSTLQLKISCADNSNHGSNGLTSLVPSEDIENGEDYLKALDWAIKDKKIKNVALAGPYGSGKSSIILTYLKKNPDIKNKALLISLASFVENQSGSDAIKLSEDEIEKGILKQLFYRVKASEIPLSRYRKLCNVSLESIWVGLIVALTLALLIVFIFDRPFFMSVIISFYDFLNYLDLKDPGWLCVFLAFIGMLLRWPAKWIRYFVTHHSITGIKISGAGELSAGADEKDTIFNKNIDEIMYFFEATRFRVVIFEDLDRLGDTSLFIRLRELNNLLNQYDGIKEKVVFVYAIKDDIFTEEDRTKFFDFIIPVVPVINGTNSGDALIQKLEESKKINDPHDISKEFVLDVAPYISDMRVLTNIYNEFLLYVRMLKTNQELKLSEEKIMAMVIFKNLYPKDFSDLQAETGIVKDAFNCKPSALRKESEQLKKEILEKKNLLSIYKNNVVNSRQGLKAAFLAEVMNFEKMAQNIESVDRSNRKSFSTREIMEKDFEFTKLLGLKNCYIGYLGWDSNGSYQNHVNKDISDLIEKYEKKWTSISQVELRGLKAIRGDLTGLQDKLQALESIPMSELIEKIGADESLPENALKNRFLVFMLRRGYIDERYADYINYFKGNSITKTDMDFILSVKDRRPMKFDYELKNINVLVTRLQSYEFKERAIRNYDLLAYLLDNQTGEHKAKLNNFIGQLGDGKEDTWDFISGFLKKDRQKRQFVHWLAHSWQEMFTYISNNADFDYDTKLTYFKLILNSADVSDIAAMDADKSVTMFLNENENILEKLKNESEDRLIAVIDRLHVKFTRILLDNDLPKVVDYIIDNYAYEINPFMMKEVLSVGTSDTKNIEHHFYSSLLIRGNSKISAYVEENFDTFIDNVFLSDTNTSESPTAMVNLIDKFSEDLEKLKVLISHQSFKFNELKESVPDDWLQNHLNLCKPIWSILLENDRVTADWSNVITYFKLFGLGDVLIKFIENHVSDFTQKPAPENFEEFTKKFLATDNIDHEVYKQLLPVIEKLPQNFELKSCQDWQIRALIDLHFIPFNVTNFKLITNSYPESGLDVQFILKNQETVIDIIDNIPISKILFEELVFNEKVIFDLSQTLISKYAKSYMTSLMAGYLLKNSYQIDVEIFNAAWGYLSPDSKDKWMQKNLSILTADMFQKCFHDLGENYAELADRTRKHYPKLLESPNIKKLAEKLEEVGYISSSKLMEENGEMYRRFSVRPK